MLAYSPFIARIQDIPLILNIEYSTCILGKRLGEGAIVIITKCSGYHIRCKPRCTRYQFQELYIISEVLNTADSHLLISISRSVF